MKYPITDYATLIFDCDGVVLNSNRVKTDAFYQAALPYGEAAAQRLVDYHVQNGGISRYAKFAYFMEYLIEPGQEGPVLKELLLRYAAEVREGLLTCEIAPGLQELRERTTHARWMIVSGGDQTELNHVFTSRGIASLFEGGIFGSPDTKDEILERELANGNIQRPALFLGDSKYDYQAASNAELDFVFLSGWSEVENSHFWVRENSLNQLEDVSSFMKSL